MRKQLAKYYAWRRRRIRRAAEKRPGKAGRMQKMSDSTRRRYQKMGLRWYKNYPHQFAGEPLGGDLTGKGLSIRDKDRISRLPGEGEVHEHALRANDSHVSFKVDYDKDTGKMKLEPVENTEPPTIPVRKPKPVSYYRPKDA